ncbi:MAG: 16S rRNA processing protein RimM [Lachnospiraceae bacterium]|nr:16S rRNA processing protein RimM [Lachnospiraceae bacterium]
MVNYFRVGVVSSVHGLKGEVKIFPTGQEPQRFYDYGSVFLAKPDAPEETYASYDILSVKQAKKQLILLFSGITSPEEARTLLGKEIWIPREKGVPLAEGEHYVADLIGCRIVEEDGSLLGELENVLETGANDVYVCRMPEGGQMLIPVIPDCLLGAFPEQNEIRVRLLPGLKELYQEKPAAGKKAGRKP